MLENKHFRNLAFLGAIVGGTLIGPVTGVASLGLAGVGLASLLGNLWTSELAARRAEKMLGPAYIYPVDDLVHLLADAIGRALRQRGEQDQAHATWLNSLATVAEEHYGEIARHPCFASVSNTRLPAIFEAASNTHGGSVNLLDELVPVARLQADRTAAWVLVDFLCSSRVPPTSLEGYQHTLAERAIIEGLFGCVCEMLKRSPAAGTRTYAALQLEINGEVLARLGEIARTQQQCLDEFGVRAPQLESIKNALDTHQIELCNAIDDGFKVSMKPILDDFQVTRDSFNQVLVQLLRIREQQDEQSRTLKRIEEMMATQIQAKPNATPVLSDADRAILDEAKRHSDLKMRARASVLRPDADTDELLRELRDRHQSEEFDLRMLEGKRWYFVGDYSHAVGHFEGAIELRPTNFEARNYLTVTHVVIRSGDITAHRHRAIEVATDTLSQVPRGSFEWAMTQNNLGLAFADLRGGENLGRAISAYKSALEVLTLATYPNSWASVQGNLGAAYSAMPVGDLADNQKRSIAAYTAAAEVHTLDSHPLEWAATQVNLANTLCAMPIDDRGENLLKAIQHYTAALQVYTRADKPVEWARTQTGLGAAWAKMPTGNGGHNLRRARKAFAATLRVYTRAAYPWDWANSLSLLANALASRSTGDTNRNLRNARAAYTAALDVFKLDIYPLDWARTQLNLGLAWGKAANGDRKQNLKTAMVAFTAALQLYTFGNDPVKWALAHHNLAKASDELARLPGENVCDLLRQAISHGKAALLIRTAADFPMEHSSTNSIVANAHNVYESAGCGRDMPFDEILPAT